MAKHSRKYNKYVKQLQSGCFTDLSEAYFMEMISTMLDESDPGWAMAAVEAGLDNHPDSRPIKRLEILVRSQLGQTTETQQKLGEYLSKEDIHLLDSVFNAAADAGLYKEACLVYTEAVHAGVITPTEVCIRLNSMVGTIPNELIVSELEQLFTSYPNDIECQHEVCNSLLLLGQTQKSLTFSYQLTAKRPNDIKAWAHLANSLFCANEYQKSLEACERGLWIDRSYNPLIYARGIAYFKLGEWEKAEEDLRYLHYKIASKFELADRQDDFRHVSPLTDEEQAFLEYSIDVLVECYKAMNKATAIEYQTLKCEMHPDDPQHLFKLATLQLAWGRTPAALSSIEAALRLDPTKLDYMKMRVMLLLETKKPLKEVVLALQEMTRVHPGEPQGWLTLGEIYRQMGFDDEAEQSYRQARALKPTEKSFRKLLEAYFDSIGDPMPPDEEDFKN